MGFDARGSKLESTLRRLMLETGSGPVLREGIAAMRRGGTRSIPGVYVGFLHGFLIGDAFDKVLTFASRVGARALAATRPCKQVMRDTRVVW